MTLIVTGIDPGFANMGIASIAYSDGEVSFVDGSVVRTKPDPRKKVSNLRVSTDDQRRFKELVNALLSLKGSQHAFAVEVYTPYRAQGGSAWKSGAAYGGVSFWAHAQGVPVFAFVPQDIKREFLGKTSGSKKELEEAVSKKVVGLDLALAGLKPQSLREHLADAAAHAYLGIKQLREMRRALGI